jgi:hypothetical protein
MAKKIKVLDNVSGVEQIINVSSLASNGTITGSDLMLIEQSNTLKKVSITDLSAEFSGGGGGNTYTISLPFSKGGGNVNGSVTVPENAVLLNCWIKIEEELSTTGAPFLIRLDGSSPLLIAEQGYDFSEFVGNYRVYDYNGGASLTDSFHVVTSADSGVLQANHSGSGFGSGIIYLQYSTELS